MDSKKVAFIICSDKEIQLKRCISYINELNVPSGIKTEIITLQDSMGLCHAYNKAMGRTNAMFKVYLHHDTYIINRDFIEDMILCFKRHPKAGMLGVIGRKNFANRERLYQNRHYGTLLETGGEQEILYNRYSEKSDEKVLHIDGLLMMTCVDIKWREDLFQGWHLYDVSQSLEMDRAGYEIYVPYMDTHWVVHDCGRYNLDGYEKARDKAIETYKEYFGKKRIYTEYAYKFAYEIGARYAVCTDPGVSKVRFAVILPLKDVRKNAFDYSSYEGGICDRDGNFIAGSVSAKRRFCSHSAYKVKDDEISRIDEIVVFGGVFYHHFGVMMLLSLTRFWWITENQETPHRIAFLLEPGDSPLARSNLDTVLELLNIPKEKILVVDRPTEFSEVIIPEESFFEKFDGVNRKYIEVFNYIRDKIISTYGPVGVEKLYLSRSRYHKGNQICDGINEEYYEQFYKRRGYTVIHPQELSIKEQIRYIASAKEIVSTYGTLAHLVSLFSSCGAKQTMLLRTQYIDDWFYAQAAILSLKEIDWYIVEAAHNPYPSSHDGGAFLYCPTDYFRAFLDAEEITYDEGELETTLTNDDIKRYMIRWLEAFSLPGNFARLHKPEMFPVLQSLYYLFTKKKLDEKDYVKD